MTISQQVSFGEPLRPGLVGLPPNARFSLGPQRYPKVRVDRGVGIRMSDGVILSADITRPAYRRGVAVDEPLPVVVSLTPYNKTLLTRSAPLIGLLGHFGPAVYRLVPSSRHGRAGGREVLRTLGGGALEAVSANRTLISRGFVHVAVDVRGTGTSTGRLEAFSEREQQDAQEVLSWVRAQPWCDGDLAMTGISYLAITALHAAGRRPEGLKAVFAMMGSADLTKDLMLTGGVQSMFTIGWLAAVNAVKWLPSVPALVRTGALRSYVRDRMASPGTRFGDVTRSILSDDHVEHWYHEDSVMRCPRIEDITAATWLQAGWHDVFVHSATTLFERMQLAPGAGQLVVEDTYHIAPGTGFGAADYPQRLDELQCAFFERWVKGFDNGIDAYGPITIRQQGAGWVSRAEFPAPRATVHSWYLSAKNTGSADHSAYDGSLSASPDKATTEVRLPRRRPGIASQTTSWGLMGLTAVLGSKWAVDDRGHEKGAVTFTSDPLPEDMLISGPINLHLRVRTLGIDAFWLATVCDVAPDGVSSVIARGALRSSRRAIDEDSSLRVGGELLAARHPLTAEAVLPVQPGIPHELDIDINPTEAVLRAGHRLRVAVARTSWPRFYLTPRVAWKMRRAQEIVLDPGQPSRLVLMAAPADSNAATDLSA